jgi:hypothetical protein
MKSIKKGGITIRSYLNNGIAIVEIARLYPYGVK